MSESANLIEEYDNMCAFDEIVMKHNESFNANTLEEIYNNTYNYKNYKETGIVSVLGMDIFKQITLLNHTWNKNKYKMLRKIMEIIRYTDENFKFKYQLYDLCLTLKYLLKIGDINIHKNLGNHYLTPYEHCCLLDICLVTHIFKQYM